MMKNRRKDELVITMKDLSLDNLFKDRTLDYFNNSLQLFTPSSCTLNTDLC